MRTINILIVEDESIITDISRLYLEKEGYTVYSSLNAADGLRFIEEDAPDIVLLDINLPDLNGFDLARRYREVSDGILIFITGERTRSTIIEGFEIGCDDYITKPFDPPEVLARIKAIMRRSDTLASNEVHLGDLTINFSDKSIYKKGKEVDLFTKERMLLFYLVEHPNQVFSAEQLFDLIWGIDSDANLKTVSVHLSTLRSKIEDDPKNPKYIRTVRGFGYKFSTQAKKEIRHSPQGIKN
ncbi:response regulator transcription factor [Bacillus sp. EB600]|uniref:response regulator transcription factor n=1 Tax=Bacillus sp. EB600 TaxID=2806345 RepID=UPI00210B42FC|nr:response regulator transcription factor [Bacillus sp. EB600]MCQ6277637.1 response regulator transcription factor [Bacillus sp. EB600]